MDRLMTQTALDALSGFPHWIAWRVEERNGKPTKVPISSRRGQRAASNQPETWGSLEEARAAVERYDSAGIGFVFTADDPFVGIDLDKCREPETGVIEPWAKSITFAVRIIR